VARRASDSGSDQVIPMRLERTSSTTSSSTHYARGIVRDDVANALFERYRAWQGAGVRRRIWARDLPVGRSETPRSSRVRLDVAQPTRHESPW